MRILAILILSWLSAWQAAAQSVDAGRAQVELISERSVAVPGETVWLGLSFELDPGWHIYWLNAGDAGIPPSISWAETSDLTTDLAGEFSWPTPELLPIVEGEIMDYGYSDFVVLPFPIQVPEDSTGEFTATGRTDYLICKDICIPESADLNLSFGVGDTQSPNIEDASLISTALADVPPVFDGEARFTKRGESWVLSAAGAALTGDINEARFFPDDHDIKHAADQPVSFGESGLQLVLTPSGPTDLPEKLSGIIKIGESAVRIDPVAGDILPGTSGRQQAPAINLAGLILLAMIGGMILNLMPCVLPVLSIKALGFVHSAAEGQASDVRRHGLWYTAGVLTCFAGLAFAVIAVRAATGIATWGFWLQDPLVVTALILLLFVIGLWLLGWIEFGSSLQSVGDSLAQKQGSAGAFFTGALAAVVGAPCTGPFLGAALGAVLTQSDLPIFIVLIAMGFGMALPILLLSMIPGLQSRLPKPGAWMDTLKQVFAFPMFLTAAWLLSVLGALSGYRSAAIIVAGAALIAFGFWALRAGRANGKALLLSLLGLATVLPVFLLMSASTGFEFLTGGAWLLGLIMAFVVIARLPAGPVRGLAQALAAAALIGGFAWPVWQSTSAVPATATQTAYQAGYETEAWSPERVAELQAEGRAIFVDFTAEWCATCQANKLQTLQTRAVSEAFTSANVAFLVADYTRPDPVIAAALKEHNRAGVPMYLWYEAGAARPEVLPEILSVGLVTGLVEAN